MTSRPLHINKKGEGSHTSLILMIVMVSITVGGIMIFYDFQRTSAAVPRNILDNSFERQQNDLVFVSVVGRDTTGRNMSGIRFQVRYEGDEKLSINDSFIQIRMPDSIADLKYRDGTLERDSGVGYYTQ
jgi:hypothetical protein